MGELRIPRDRSVPAAIQYKNPGAMWGKGNPTATRWGSSGYVMLNDGLNQGNNIAVFATWVAGICAQLDMWRSSPHYRNKRFADAIATWSGGNNVPSYIAYVKARVPGMTENTIMDDAFWLSPQGIGFLKAQAGHEAGRPIPAPDADYVEAQRRVFANKIPIPAPAKKATAAVATTTTSTTAVVVHAVHSGWNPLWIVALVVAGIGLTVFAAWFFHQEGEG